MDVRIDRHAWLPKSGYTAEQQEAIKIKLTVVPHKVGDFPGAPPEPLHLWEETETHLGVPRAYFLQNRRPHHVLNCEGYEYGTPMTPFPKFSGDLRPGQDEALASVVGQFRVDSCSGGVIQAVPGWGKSAWSCALIGALQVPALVVVHKEFLMSQWVERLSQFLPDARLGLVQQDTCDYEDKHVVLAMVHSLASKRYVAELYRHFGLLVTDECFPAGTLVSTPYGPQSIESFQEGDRVLNAFGSSRVLRTHRREVDITDLRLIRFSDGTEELCTADHPFLSVDDGRWVGAQYLLGHRVLTAAGCFDTVSTHGYDVPNSGNLSDVREDELRPNWAQVLFSCVYREVEDSASGPSAPLRVVWSESGEKDSKPVLFRCLSAELVAGGAGTTRAGDLLSDSKVAREEPLGGTGSVGADDQEESDAPTGDSGSCISDAQGERARPFDSRGERATNACSAEDVVGSIGFGMGGRVCVANARPTAEREASSQSLQDRLGVPEEEDRGGGRWSLSSESEGSSQRYQEREVPAFLRVASVSIPERDDLARRGLYCAPGTLRVLVYNLSVAGHPSYILHGSKVLVHNCHRIGAHTWCVVPSQFAARWRVGLTATPRRKDGADNVFWFHIGERLYTSTTQQLPVKVKRVWSNFKLVKTDSFNPAMAPRSLILQFLVACPPRNVRIAQEVVKAAAAGRKVLVLSERLKHLDRLDSAFRENWRETSEEPVPSVGFYVGGMNQEEREEAAKADVIFATMQFVSEGLDIPALDTLVLASPMSDVEQAVGRIQRAVPGKKPPIVVDIRDDNIVAFKRAGESRDRLYRKVADSSPS